MKKIAFFVEGYTEFCFVEKFLTEVAGRKNLHIIEQYGFGGSQCQREFRKLGTTSSQPANASYFALISNCRADNKVASDINDQYTALINAGYSLIIGIRDVYPDHSRDEVVTIRSRLNRYLKSARPEVVVILGVMEIEAWFLAEHSHFQKIDPAITVERIISSLGFDPSNDDMSRRAHPADDLHNAYQLKGLAYRKKPHQIERTVNSLDCAKIYLELGRKFEDIQTLVDSIDSFLS